jgi:3-isopropylmalate/(R)-2-methylmalate dehydratase large subunit
MTVAEKILAKAAGRSSVSPGEYHLIQPSSVTVIAPHTARMKRLDQMLDWGRPLFDPARVMIVDGHHGASASHGAAEGREIVRRWATAMQIPGANYVRLGRGGIENMVAVQRCWVLPGECYFQGVNGHISTAGALGAFASALSYETAAFLIRGKTWAKVPPTVRVQVVGEAPAGVLPRDVSEALLAQIGPTGAVGAVLEWCGDYIDNLPMDGRFALCSQALFCGAWTAIINPDQTTTDYVAARSSADYEAMTSDSDARYWKTVTLDISRLEPLVVVPPTRRDIRPVTDLDTIAITKGFIGSDAGGWSTDLDVAAEILRGRAIRDDVVLNVTPGTVEILRHALRERLIEVFLDAGCVIPTPNEGMECGYNTPLEDGDVCIATAQTNHPGRMGSESAEIYLANAAVVAASCVEGRIVDPRPYLS